MIVLTFTMLASAVCGQEPLQLSARVQSSDVYQGDTVQFQIVVANVAQPTEPKIPATDAFTIRKVDERSMNEQVIRIINGVRQETHNYRRIYVYQLTPTKSGQLTIDAPVMTLADGTELRGNPVKINVVGAEKSDTVFVEASLDRDHYFVSQPIHISLLVGIQALPGNAARENPLRLYAGDTFRRDSLPPPPQLMIPWMDDERLPDQLSPEREVSEILSELHNDDGIGFQINQFGADRASSLLRLSTFFNTSTVFQPKPNRVERVDSSGKTRTYWTYLFERTFIGQDIGDISLSPVTLKGVFLGTDVNDRAVRVPIFSATEPLVIKIMDAPREGRPADYIGAIGKFTISSRLSATEAHVGDPLELEVVLSGSGATNRIQPLDLNGQPGFAEQFRFHDPSEKAEAGAKRFLYRIRPLHDRVKEVPSLQASYFDVDSEKFITLRTAAIPLKVLPTAQLSEHEIATVEQDSGQNSQLSGKTEGDATNSTTRLPLMTVSAYSHDAIRWSRWIGVWLSLLVSYAAVTLLIVRHRTRTRKGSMIERRVVMDQFQRQLADQKRRVKRGAEPRTELDALHRLVMQTIGDLTGCTALGLTAQEARDKLLTIGLSPDAIERFTVWASEYDAMRYGSATRRGDMLDDGIAMAEGLIDALVRRGTQL